MNISGATSEDGKAEDADLEVPLATVSKIKTVFIWDFGWCFLMSIAYGVIYFT